MSELKDIKARAAERRADKYGGRISLDSAWQDAEAALDRAIAIAEKWFDGLCDANREAERHMTERDEARAAVLALRVYVDGTKLRTPNWREQLLADTESYEQYRKECDD